jgi:hypothetical protein
MVDSSSTSLSPSQESNKAVSVDQQTPRRKQRRTIDDDPDTPHVDRVVIADTRLVVEDDFRSKVLRRAD